MSDSGAAVADVEMAAETKVETAPVDANTPSDVESTPEREARPGSASQEQPAQPVKRKGGRKPVCLGRHTI